MKEQPLAVCRECKAKSARLYEFYKLITVGEPVEPQRIWLCVKCARRERRAIREARRTSPHNANDQGVTSLSREDLIAELDRFWAESGAGEICRRCHEQGTGCCPPMCRHLGERGCLKKNVFCTSFVCSALLNAITECDAQKGRLLKWIKSNPGAAEFRVYEMVTRVPAQDREEVRPLIVPEQYPGPLELSGGTMKNQLLALADEVLEIRRRWHQEELGQLLSTKNEQ